jgi:acyl transferase domain-containing protein/acyl carrier protein
MVAVHVARQSLLNGESDIALAGAISVRVPHRAGYFCDGGGVVSPDGHVRAFDAKANGTVFGSGGGILVLKRLADAIAEGDNIHAVIKGSAVNNDGSEKAGYTTPSVNGQADVVVEALANAGVEADSITYVEAHGSGTPVGDPIEIRALTKGFRNFTQRSDYCAIGSVKSNLGHLDAAAAVAGMIKTILALKHRSLPPSLHFSQANPEIDFKRTPFYVNTELRKWTSDGPRRAGVMSTGMGGTNAHMVFEEAPESRQGSAVDPSHLLILSARSRAALDHTTHRLCDFLERNDSVNMNDVAHTLRVGRRMFPHRRYLVCGSREDAMGALAEENSKRVFSSVKDESAERPVVFMFPGIGDHYVGMGHGLYESWDVFRQEVDRCAQILAPYLGTDIRKIIYPDGQGWKSEGNSRGIDLKKMLGRSTDAPIDDHATDLNKTLFAQPALFAVEYALARLWQSFGIIPAAIVGHSMGEYVAACLAGVLSLEDALRLIATRARLVNDLPQGAMLAVTLSEKEVLPLLTGDLSISLINGPALCVVAGPAAAVVEFERLLNEKQIITRRVQNAHAFHSRMLSPMVGAFENEVRNVRLNQPGIPYISNVTGGWITGRDAISPSYWAMHADHTSRFNDALGELWRLKNPILVEAGPGRTLGVLAMQHPGRQNTADPITISSIRPHYENHSDVEFLLQGIGRLWLSGVEVSWESIYPGQRRRRISLPTYPFERRNYWIESTPANTNIAQEQKSVPAPSGLDDWFYTASWKRTQFPSDIVHASHPAFWLIIADRYGGGSRLKSKLEALGMSVALVRFGETCVRHADGSFELNPAGIEGYRELFLELERRTAGAPIHIVHLGSLTREDEEAAQARPADQNFGFFSLLHIAQAMGELRTSIPTKIGVISNRLHSVTGEEDVAPAMATLLGPCGVIPREYPNIKCFNIDLPDSQPFERLPEEWLARIISEYAEEHASRVIAYRGRYRWERHFEPVKLNETPASRAPSGAPVIRRLRPGGVYLITGGTGGLGLAIAGYLAKACRPRLVLTKKSPFPKKSTWNKLAAAPETPAPLRKTITALLEIENRGAEINVLVAEASDREQMRTAVDEALAMYGTINGVIHAAGIVRAGLIQAKTRETADSVLAPKVYGTMVLFDLLKKVKPDFLVVFSSITSILTPYAECDYSAANCFLDAFSCFANDHGGFHTLAINWPGWREVGQLADLATLPGLEGWKQAALERAIMSKDGLEAFKRALNSDLTQVIVSPENLDHLLRASEETFDPTEYLSRVQPLDGAFRPPASRQHEADQVTNPVQAALLKIWSSVFGFEQIGIDDNFIDLGGHSLLAMQIVSRIRSLYQIPFTLRDFFEISTIGQLSSVIQARILAEIEGLSDEQVRRLISNN